MRIFLANLAPPPFFEALELHDIEPYHYYFCVVIHATHDIHLPSNSGLVNMQKCDLELDFWS